MLESAETLRLRDMRLGDVRLGDVRLGDVRYQTSDLETGRHLKSDISHPFPTVSKSIVS